MNWPEGRCLILRPITIGPLMLPLLCTPAGIASAQIPARVETAYPLEQTEHPTQRTWTRLLLHDYYVEEIFA